jgi:hypothetical protein
MICGPMPSAITFVIGMFKEIVFFITFVAFVGFPSAGQDSKTDREKAGLIGSVKSITSSSADYSGEKIEGKGYSIKPPETVSYDVAGNEVEDQMVSDFGSQMGKTTNKFDQERRLIESVWTDPKGNILRKDVYTYTDGRLSEIKTYDEKDVLREKTAHVYNDKQLLLEEVYYDPAKPVAKTVYRYDPKRTDPLEIAFFMADGRKATAPVGPCMGAHRLVYTYDGRGRIATKDVFEDDGAFKKGYGWTYDEKGNIATYFIKSRGSRTTFIYRYEYDSRGNWIKQIAVGTSKEDGVDVFGKPAPPYVRTTVTTRVVTYY